VKVDPLIVAEFTASLNVALIATPTGMFIAPFVGIVDTTTGAGVVVVNYRPGLSHPW
jgi:hypothetical protein